MRAPTRRLKPSYREPYHISLRLIRHHASTTLRALLLVRPCPLATTLCAMRAGRQRVARRGPCGRYINPELAEQARQEGNELFKDGKFAEAIGKYNDAMKRNPKDHVPYSNRAACYQKLMEWQLALKDAETAITMEPTFVKGWSRKAGVHYFLKEYHKAMDAYNAILKLEPDNAEAKAGLDNVVATINMQSSSGEVDQERQARAMADPEIQAILGDAQMRSILNEMQTDPKKAQAAMNDPTISAKLQKLIAAGVLQVR